MAPKKPHKTGLRRCSHCQKSGHNKSTCPVIFEKETAIRQPLKFFVHHINYGKHDSSHIIDLKNQQLWEKIDSESPQETNSLYNFSRTRSKNLKKESSPDEPFSTPAGLKEKQVSFLPAKERRLFKAANAFKDNFAGIARKVNPHHLKLGVGINLKKTAAALAFIFLLTVIPGSARTYYAEVKSTALKISTNSYEGFSALKDSTAALVGGDIGLAQESLVRALQNFNGAVTVLDNEHKTLQKIISAIPVLNDEIKGRQKLITAGQKITLGNTYLLKGLGEIKENVSSTLTANIKIMSEHLGFSVPYYSSALDDLNAIDQNAIPFEYQETFKEFRILFTAFLSDLKNISNLSNSVQNIFGGEGLRRYLLVFQNPAELRPTGGFLGSLAIIDVKNGQLISLEVPSGGSYDLQGQLNEFVEPPVPLLLSNKRWEFQDANWFPDFEASAQKMLWFYRHSRNVTADGVIAVNASVLNRILSIIGPVYDEKRGLTINQENALETLQNIVEYGPEKKENKPKQILADLANTIINYFYNIKSSDILPLFINLQESLDQKEIQAYFTDEATQSAIKEFGWSGKILNTGEGQDYVLAVNTNIQGQKSDAKIKQTISHQAAIQPDGTIIDSVVITREHTGQPDDQMYGGTNIDYLRLYVPRGSALVKASGFTWPDERKFKAPEDWYKKDAFLSEKEMELGFDKESGTRITEEFGKTAFANWVITEPGQISQAQFIYKLPFKAWSEQPAGTISNWIKMFQGDSLLSKYQLAVQKQSGIESRFESAVIYPENFEPVWKEGENITLASNGAAIKDEPLERDLVWSLVMKQKTN